MFLTVNDSVTFGVTCAVYYENELNLESDWVLPEVSYWRANQEWQWRRVLFTIVR